MKEVWYCTKEDKPIARGDMVKGYEVEKGSYITVEDEELRKIAPPTATTMEILQFVATGDVDPLLFESSCYVAPDEKAEKPWALFRAALTESRRDAIAKLAMHNREHLVLIRPSEDGLVLHTLFYEDELHRSKRAAPSKPKFSAKELTMAKNLVEQLTDKFRLAQFHDAYRENVERLIAEKRKGEKITTVKQPRKAPVIDLMEALRKSVEAAKSSHTAPNTAKKPARKRRAA